jgi:hypothetical protein
MTPRRLFATHLLRIVVVLLAKADRLLPFGTALAYELIEFLTEKQK